MTLHTPSITPADTGIDWDAVRRWVAANRGGMCPDARVFPRRGESRDSYLQRVTAAAEVETDIALTFARGYWEQEAAHMIHKARFQEANVMDIGTPVVETYWTEGPWVDPFYHPTARDGLRGMGD